MVVHRSNPSCFDISAYGTSSTVKPCSRSHEFNRVKFFSEMTTSGEILKMLLFISYISRLVMWKQFSFPKKSTSQLYSSSIKKPSLFQSKTFSYSNQKPSQIPIPNLPKHLLATPTMLPLHPSLLLLHMQFTNIFLYITNHFLFDSTSNICAKEKGNFSI